MSQPNDIEALKAFIDDNEDLEHLESIIDQFNMFESLGLVRQEILHSSFLHWLLDPAETHGLSDYWLRHFLRVVIKNGEEILGNRLSLFDLDGWDFSGAEVRKEWRNIDLLIVDDHNMFVCVIENKVDSNEHSDQLNRYQKTVEREFEQHKRVFVFLTVSGTAASNSSYIAISYKDLISAIENALRRRKSQLNAEIYLFVSQYVDMVRRRILKESEIQKYCGRIYQNHRRALDLIFQHRKNRLTEVGGVIQNYIDSRSDDFFAINNSTTDIKFLPRHMCVPEIDDGEKNPLLAWVLVNRGQKVQFSLQLRPGDKAIRGKIFEIAQRHPDIFGKALPSLSQDFPVFFSKTWISKEEYYELDDSEIEQRIGERINNLLATKGEGMAQALRELT